MYAVALVFRKGASIVTEIWVEIETKSPEEAIEVATNSVASNMWRMAGYAIVNNAVVEQKSTAIVPVKEDPPAEPKRSRRKKTEDSAV